VVGFFLSDLIDGAVLILGSGNEIGPFRAVEESTLAHLTPHELLSDVFAWYSLIGTAGSALGMLICGWIINSLESIHGWEFIPSCRIIFFVYAGVGIVKLILTLGLSGKVEVQKEDASENGETRALLDPNPEQEQEAPKKKGLFASIEKDLWSLVIRLFILFGLDAFASGLASL
jgi:MFS family permease